MSELDGVKVGDKLIIECSSSPKRVIDVERTTDKQIIADGKRYWKLDGYVVGSSTGFTFSKVRIPKTGEIEEIEERMLTAKYRYYIEKKLWKLQLDKLKRIWKIIKEED